jgi:hypothetical protein
MPCNMPTACRAPTLPLWSNTCSTRRISDASGAAMLVLTDRWLLLLLLWWLPAAGAVALAAA